MHTRTSPNSLQQKPFFRPWPFTPPMRPTPTDRVHTRLRRCAHRLRRPRLTRGRLGSVPYRSELPAPAPGLHGQRQDRVSAPPRACAEPRPAASAPAPRAGRLRCAAQLAGPGRPARSIIPGSIGVGTLEDHGKPHHAPAADGEAPSSAPADDGGAVRAGRPTSDCPAEPVGFTLRRPSSWRRSPPRRPTSWTTRVGIAYDETTST